MRRLAVLLLVFVLGAGANAATVQLSADGVTDGPGNITVVTSLTTLGVVSDNDLFAYDYYLSVGDTTYGDFGKVTIWGVAHAAGVHPDGGDAGDDATVTYPYALAGLHPGGANMAAGTQFTTPVTYTGTSPSETLQIDLLSDALEVLDSVRVAVPEPVTLVLLGAGGAVLLRRRRK